MRNKGPYRFVAIDKHGEKRCWAWGSTRKIAETRIKQAIREFIRMEGHLYGANLDEWEIREDKKEDKNYLPKPAKKPPRSRRRSPDEPAV